MRTHRIFASALLTIVVLAAAAPALAEQEPQRPKHWVAAMYFHRTQRCPTCMRISAYIEEAIHAEFAAQMKQGAVSFYLVDYENEKNAKYTKAYEVTRPTLVLANIENGRVTAWTPMPKVWSLVAKKDAFFKYVQDGVRAYLEEK
jgi:hypothetical protein